MMSWFGKKKCIALGLAAVMLFSLLPSRWNWADTAVTEPERATTEASGSAEDILTTEASGSAEDVLTTEAANEKAAAGEAATEENTMAEASSEEVVTEASSTEAVTEVDNVVTDGISSDDSSGQGAATELEAVGTDDTNNVETETMKEQSVAVKLDAGNESTDTDSDDESASLLNDTSVLLKTLTFEASYKDENNKTQIIEMSTTDTAEVPYDADIFMKLEYVCGDGNLLEVGKEYVYKIPDSIRVDEEITHNLETGEGGESVGTVHISKDGTLTFVFNDNVKDRTNIPFYVQFEGGFSSDLQNERGEQNISFPTGGGNFTYTVDVTDSNKDTEDKEPGELGVSKYGYKTYTTVNGKSTPVIQWTVSINLNGRESLTADITDLLPTGLTYAKVDGYPQLSGSSGLASCDAEDGASDISIHVDNAKANSWVDVTFYTYFDNDIFSGTTISNNSGVSVQNTVAVDEDGSSTSVTGTGNCYVSPSVLSKSGTQNGDSITWTVTINKDQLNVGGTTYTDTFGEGYSWGAAKSVTVQPADAGNVIIDDGGFTFEAAEDTRDTITLTYTTKINSFTQSQFTNAGTLTGGAFNAKTSATVKGYNLLSKTNTGYNEVTKQLTWRIAVNEDGYDLGSDTVTVTDIYNVTGKKQNEMKLISMTVTDKAGNVLEEGKDYTENNGSVVFSSLGENTRYITVVTQILDEKNSTDSYEAYEDKWQDGSWPMVYNQAKLEWGNNEVLAQAAKQIYYTEPQLISKDGKIQGDGTVEWIIYFYYKDMTQESINIEDVLPEEMEYVAGSMEIMENTWTTSSVKSLTPTVEDSKISVTIDDTSDASEYLSKNFEIHYKTKLKNRADANIKKTYTNSATATVDYEGDIQVTDTATKTVEGEVGGTLGKEAYYQNGNDYIDWTVTVNEAGYDLNVDNPVIRDHLEDYLDYVNDSAKLYRVDNGIKTEVSNFTVTVVNNEMVVALPAITNESYIFTFRTKFNVTPSKAATLTVKNTVDFEGGAQNESVTSNEIKNVSFSSSSAGAYIEKELRIKKVDKDGKALAGATFDLYYEGMYVTTVTTGSDGYAVFKGVNSSTTGYTYVLKETTAPDGYKKLDQDISVVITDGKMNSDTTGVRYIEEAVVNAAINEEQQTEFSIYKTDENSKALAGAEFTVYSDAVCKNSVAAKTTGADGKISFTVEYNTGDTATEYYVKETTVPEGYKDGGAAVIYHIVIAADGTLTCKKNDTGEAVELSANNTLNVANQKTKATFTLTKVDAADKSKALENAEYTLYADEQCSDEVAKGTTDENGKLEFTGLTPGYTYYYRETAAPTGYLLDEKVYSVTVGTGKEHEDVSGEATVEDELALGYIQITKTDDTAKANKLAGVTFELYNNDDTPYQVDGETLTATTDSTGAAVFNDIPFGTYIVKETGTPNGYVANTDGTTVTVNSTTGSKVTVINRMIQFSIKVIKKDDTGNTLSGVYFTVKNKNTGAVVAGGETGNDGTITFSNLPYGNYTVTETKGLPGYTVAESQEVLEADITNGITIEKTFTNVKQNATIQFIKQDKDNKPLSGAEFSVYNSSGELVKTVTSGEDGKVVIDNLIYDTYTIKETKAPVQYQLDATREWTVKVEENSIYTLNEAQGTILEGGGDEAVVENEKLPTGIKYMSFNISKTDDSGEPLVGAKFRLSRKYANGEWEVISTAYSDTLGIVEFYNISVEGDENKQTTYKVEEVEAPKGYELGKTYSKEYTFDELPGATYNNVAIGYETILENFENVPTIDTYQNTQILGSIWVSKTGLNTVNTLSGAEFTLYKYNAVTSRYEIYQKEGKNYIITTDETGSGVFTDLPYGTYMVKETKAPQGYVLNAANQRTVTIDENNYPDNANGEPVKLSFVDTAINVSVNKFAVGGSTQLAGAVLELYENGSTKCLQSWTTTDNAQKLDYSKLEAGKTYYIHEKTAPTGYTMSEDVYFTINSNGTLTYVSGANGSVSGSSVIMRDQTISLRILKQTMTADATAQNLSGAAISLIDDSTGQTVYSFTSTTEAEIIPYEKLSVPAMGYHYYTVHEDSAPGGYALAQDIKIAIDGNGNVYSVGENGTVGASLNDKTVVMYDEEYVDFYFAKRDAVTGEALSGAQFTITDINGGVKAQWISSNTPENIALENGTYIFTEVAAPDGYGLENAITFRVVGEAGNRYIEILDGDAYSLSANGLMLTSRDERISVQFVKWSDQYQPLSGGTFELHESDAQGTIGSLLDTFTSTGETMTLDNQNFKLGGYYVIVEQEAPENYDVTEPVYFYINDNGELEDLDGNLIDSNVVIFVDGEKQMCFQKVDGVTGNPVSGVEMRITSQEDEDFETISWTTDGTTKYFGYSLFRRNVTYSLEETETVNGYSYAKSISFFIDDEGVVYVNETAQQTSTVVMKNTPLTVSVDKQILGTSTGLGGAVLQVTDGQGTVLEQWETDGKPHSLDASKLHASLKGDEYVYTLSEVKAPELYTMAQPIQFVIDKDGNVVVDGTTVSDNTLVMYDEYQGITTTEQTEPPHTEVIPENNDVPSNEEKTEVTEEEEEDEEEEENQDEDDGETIDQGKKTTSKKTGDATPIQGAALMFLFSVTGFGGTMFYKKRKRK